MKLSSFLSLNLQDLGKGFIVAAGVIILGALTTWLSATPPHFPTWVELWGVTKAGFAAGVVYLLKNFLTPTPTTVQIDPSKTTVVDKDSKGIISNAN